jgi:hypothetical protein
MSAAMFDGELCTYKLLDKVKLKFENSASD